MAVIVIGPLVAARLRVAGIMGLLLGGFLIGPEGLDLISDQLEALEALGEIGLLYLMFIAGLELDLKTFNLNRSSAVSFGLVSFGLPFAIGIGVGLALSYPLAAAILIGSLFGSHTLLTYPEVRARGLAGQASVAVAVGGTVITDTVALLILALVAGSETGSAGGFELIAGLALSLAILVAFCFGLLPWITRLFFEGAGQERNLRFLFVFIAALAGGVLAEMLGVEAIVGAFFAGLGLNRLVPNRSPLMDRVEFFGAAFIIPFFLISVGLLIDPAVIADPETLGLAGAFLAVVLVGKAGAAVITGLRSGWDRDAMGVTFGLSLAQAAATLAAASVGLEIGLLDAGDLNAILVVVIFSVAIASIATAYFSGRMTPDDSGDGRIGGHILVPVASGATAAGGIRIAARIAAPDGGLVRPLHIVTAPHELETAREELRAVDEQASRAGISTDSMLRFADNVPSAVLAAVLEEGASMIVVGGRRQRVAERIFGARAHPALEASSVPVLVTFLNGESFERVLVPLGADDLGSASPDLNALLAVITNLSESLPVEIAAAEPEALASWDLPESARLARLEQDRRAWIEAHAEPGDLILLPGRPGSYAPTTEALELSERMGLSIAVCSQPYGRGVLSPGELLGSQVVASRRS